MLAQNGTWARRRSENLLLAALTASCTIHCSWLLNYRWELILDIIDDARSDSLFHLLGEHATFVFIVLESHGCDFFRCVGILEVLQRLWHELLMWDVQALAGQLGIFLQRSILLEQEPTQFDSL